MPTRKLHQPNWPDINYQNLGMQDLGVQQLPKAMVTKVRNYAGVNTDRLLNNIHNMHELEENIVSSINNCAINDNNQIIDIFHKIEIWGGRAAGSTYTRDGGFNKNININAYIELIKACVSIHNNNDDSLGIIYNKAIECNEYCKNFGVSYISKHIYFWTMKSLGDNALPIYDGYIATGLYDRKQELDHIVYYWQDMREKANSEGITIRVLERAIFNQFR